MPWAPSPEGMVSAGTPQSATCAECPQAVWGSKISPQGSKIPACSTVKKVAVLVEETGKVAIRMTLTAPNCPVAGSLPAEVERAVRAVPGVTDVSVELTFDPPYSKDRMSDVAKLALGFEDTLPVMRPRG